MDGKGMTFIPVVLTKEDAQNSGTTTGSFVGTGTDTTGYASVIVEVAATANSVPLGLEVQSSGDNATWVSSFSDTVIATNTFRKVYPILAGYYRVVYTASTGTATIPSRLSTQEYPYYGTNSVSAFVNQAESRIDAFGRLRVSEPFTLLDIRMPGQTTGSSLFLSNDLQLTTKSTGTASSTATNGVITLSVSGVAKETSQSRKYCIYQSGKSFLIMMSGVMDSNANGGGVLSRIGYFDDQNGLFFQYDPAGSCSCVLRSNSADTSYAQSAWNIDGMDGTGTSGLALDFTKAQLFVIDLEWLGVGRVRFGFYVYGQVWFCHEITNVNSIALPYTKNINLPIRYEIQSSSVGTAGQMLQICSSVSSEGGYSPIGRPFSASVSNVAAPVSTSTEAPILFLRGGSTNFYHQTIQPTEFSVTSTATNDVFIFRLRLFLPENVGDITGLAWNNVNSRSVAQYATSYSTISYTNSIIVGENTASGKGYTNLLDLDRIFNNLFQITSDVDNVSGIVVLTVQGSFGGGSALYSTINWSEIY